MWTFSGLMSRWTIFCVCDVLQRPRHLQRDLELVCRSPVLPVPDGVAQILAAQKLHHHERAMLFVFAEIVNAEDVVVREVAGHARFGQETRLDLFILAALLRSGS